MLKSFLLILLAIAIANGCSSSGPEGPRCTGTKNCCTVDNPCGENQGDCKNDDDCEGDLVCADGNANFCIKGKDWDSTDNCCRSKKSLTPSENVLYTASQVGETFTGKIGANSNGGEAGVETKVDVSSTLEKTKDLLEAGVKAVGNSEIVEHFGENYVIPVARAVENTIQNAFTADNTSNPNA